MKATLKPCPCGKTPTALSIEPGSCGYVFAWVLGNCCGEWAIEFQPENYDITSNVTKQLAIKAWNRAPRNDRKNP